MVTRITIHHRPKTKGSCSIAKAMPSHLPPPPPASDLPALLRPKSVTWRTRNVMVSSFGAPPEQVVSSIKERPNMVINRIYVRDLLKG